MNVPKSNEGLRIPHANRMEVYCPIAKFGGCLYFNEPKKVYCDNLNNCELDESLDKGYMVFEEDFKHEKGEGIINPSEFHKEIQEEIDKAIKDRFNVKNNYLTLIGVDCTPRLTTLNMKFVCPIYFNNKLSLKEDDNKFKLILDISNKDKLKKSHEDLMNLHYNYFLKRINEFIKSKHKTWMSLKEI